MAQAPRFYIFHGQDEFSQKETLTGLKSRMGGDPAMVELNTTYLNGRTVQLSQLMHTCNSFPFLSDKRLVVVEGLIERLSDKEQRAERGALLNYLPQLPPTTRLVLLERNKLSSNNAFIKLAASSPTGYAKVFNVPQGVMLERWTSQRVEKKEGAIHPRAAELLAANVGGNLRLLEMEITKLLAYVNFARPIQPADVELMTPYMGQVVIFDLVDAIGQRRGQKAAILLRRKLEAGDQPLYLLAMIIRQFRLLIQVREKIEAGAGKDEIARQVKIHPYVAGKLSPQARNFNLPQLEAIYRRLLDTDVAIKTGRLEPAVALELLVAELAASP